MLHERECETFLRRLHPGSTWGYTLYRTTYTPESDAHWPSIIALLSSYIRSSIEFDLCAPKIHPEFYVGCAPCDPEPNRKVREMFRWDVVSNAAQFDGATIDDVRVHFRDRMARRPNDPHWKCLVVDEEVFQLLKGRPLAKPDEVDNEEAWIKAVDKSWRGPEDSDRPGYEGWIGVQLGMLWEWWILAEGDPYEMWWDGNADGKPGIYTGIP